MNPVDDLPPPPYQVRDVTYLGFEVEPEKRGLPPLPLGLTAASPLRVWILVFVVPEGWAIAPYSCVQAHIEINEFPSTNGWKARYALATHYSPLAHRALGRYQKLGALGFGRIETSHEDVVAHGGSDDGLDIRMTADWIDQDPKALNGGRSYLSPHAHGGLGVSSVTYSNHQYVLQPSALEIVAPPGSAMSKLRVKRLLGAVFTRDGALTLGPYSRLDGPAALKDVPRADATAPTAAVVAMLEELGLSPAEALVAAMIGSGLAPKAVATLSGRTELTVRSMLKTIFRKLGINRQSELARLVLKVEMSSMQS